MEPNVFVDAVGKNFIRVHSNGLTSGERGIKRCIIASGVACGKMKVIEVTEWLQYQKEEILMIIEKVQGMQE